MTYPGSDVYPGESTFPSPDPPTVVDAGAIALEGGSGVAVAPDPDPPFPNTHGYPPQPEPGYVPPGTTGPLQALPVTWTVDGLTLGATDEFGCTWYVTSSNGWFGLAKPKTHRSAKFQTQGSFRSLAPRGERIIALTGTTRCPDVLTRLAALDRFAAVASDPALVYTLTVDDQRGYPRTIGVELDALTDVKLRGPRWFDWQVQFGCPDPRKHDASWQSPACGPSSPDTGGLDFSGSGLTFAGNQGLDFGTPGTSGTARVVNFGTAIAYPVFQLVGPAINPVITDLSTGLRIGYAGTIDAADTLTINSDDFDARGFPPKSCYVRTTQNHRSQLVLSGLWPQVGPGEAHDFTFTAGGTDSALSALTVFMRAAWM